MKQASSIIFFCVFICLFSSQLHAQDTVRWKNLHNLRYNAYGLRYDSTHAIGGGETRYGVATSVNVFSPNDTGSFWFTIDSVTKQHTRYGFTISNYLLNDSSETYWPWTDTSAFPSLIFYLDVSAGYAHVYELNVLVDSFAVTTGDVIKFAKEYDNFATPTDGSVNIYKNGGYETGIDYCEPCWGLTGYAFNIGVVVQANGGGIDPVQCSVGTTRNSFSSKDYSVNWDTTTFVNAAYDTLTVKILDPESGIGAGVSVNKLLDTLNGYVQYQVVPTDSGDARGFGLSSFKDFTHLGNLSYFIILDNVLYIFENNTNVGFFGSVQAGDILLVERNNGYFDWSLNGALLHESSYNMFDSISPTGDGDYGLHAFFDFFGSEGTPEYYANPGSLFDLTVSFAGPLDTPVIASTTSGYCAGNASPFKVSATNPLSYAHYKWYKNGTAITNSDFNFYYESSPPLSTTTYMAKEYDDSGDTLSSNTITITVTATPSWYRDYDGDTYGNHNDSVVACTIPSGYVSDHTDCNDSDASVHAMQTFYLDYDKDGYGNMTGIDTSRCLTGTYFVAVDGSWWQTDHTDCNDNCWICHPGATEVCDGVDDNCDGNIDEGLPLYTFYIDKDRDGYGDAAGPTLSSCLGATEANIVVGYEEIWYALDSTDCNDDISTNGNWIHDPPPVSISGNVSLCSGTSSILHPIVHYTNPYTDPIAAVVTDSTLYISYLNTTLESYLWSSSATTDSITASAAGTYSVTVTFFGCTGTASVNLTVNSPPSVSATVTANVSCYGGSNGSANAHATGGSTPYSFSWAPSGGTDSTATGLAANTYTVTATDVNGCTATATATITQPTALTDSITSATNLVIRDTCHATAKVTPYGGTSPYTYSWSPSGGTDTTATALTNGSYTVTVTDANGCTAAASIKFAIDSTTIGSELLTFSTSPDSINSGDSLLLRNLSSGFPSGTYYVFQNGNICGFDSTGTGPLPVMCVDTFYSTSDTLESIYNNCQAYEITLTAITASGIQIGQGKIVNAGWGGNLQLGCAVLEPSCDLILNGNFEISNFCPEFPGHCGTRIQAFFSSGEICNGQDGFDGWDYCGKSSVCSWIPVDGDDLCGSTGVCGVYNNGFDYFYSNASCTAEGCLDDYLVAESHVWPFHCSGVTIQPGSVPSPHYVPNNYMGYQADHSSGSGYIGLYCYPNTSVNGNRALALQKLKYPMQPLVSYQVTFYAALAYNSAYAVDGLSARFTSDPTQFYGGPISAIQNLRGLTGGDFQDGNYKYVINGTSSNTWRQITGTYVADGGEQWIYLGDFLDDDHILHASNDGLALYDGYVYDPDGIPAGCAYYYIDDVSIVPLTDITVTTTPCCLSGGIPGTATVTSIIGDGGYTYLWSPDGQTTSSITECAGTYTVTVTDANNCTATATATIVWGACRIAGKGTTTTSTSSIDTKLYPNPSTGSVTVIYQLNSNNGILQLYDMIGKKVGEFILDAKKNEFQFDIGDLCCGVFEYRVIDGDVLISNGKLVIIR